MEMIDRIVILGHGIIGFFSLGMVSSFGVVLFAINAISLGIYLTKDGIKEARKTNKVRE